MKHKVGIIRCNQYKVNDFNLLGGLVLKATVMLEKAGYGIRFKDSTQIDSLCDELDQDRLTLFADPLYVHMKKVVKSKDIIKNPIRVYFYEFISYKNVHTKMMYLRFEWDYNFKGTKLTFYRTITMRLPTTKQP